MLWRNTQNQFDHHLESTQHQSLRDFHISSIHLLLQLKHLAKIPQGCHLQFLQLSLLKILALYHHMYQVWIHPELQVLWQSLSHIRSLVKYLRMYPAQVHLILQFKLLAMNLQTFSCAVPSVDRSYDPSNVPAYVPSKIPYRAPIFLLIIFPFQKISSIPLLVTRSIPSIAPSQAPSNKPSRLSYSVPSVDPSKYSSYVPSYVISGSPSRAPSVVSSTFPSQKPSSVPSA